MMSREVAARIARGMREQGKTSTPNVEIVRMMGVDLVRGRIPATVRRELREAVKAGRLGHLKKEGLKPEAFFHPNSKANAVTLREQEERKALECLTRVCVPASEAWK
jgi:predicted transcriptional regulator